MQRPQSNENRTGCVTRVVRATILLGLVVVFWGELMLLCRFFLTIPFFFMRMQEFLLKPEELPRLGSFTLHMFCVFIFGFSLLYLVSPHVLPSRGIRERLRVVKQLLMFICGCGAPAVIVTEGQIPGGPERVKEIERGAIQVDINSAVLIERRRTLPFTGAIRVILDSFFGSKRPPVRASGPGLAFLGDGERLRGVVSLRKQFRIKLDVRGYTKDGIEVKSHVFVIFTLGQPPTVIKVGYHGGWKKENLRVLEIDNETNRIKAFSEDLDDQDKAEIHAFATQFIQDDEYRSRHSANEIAPNENFTEFPPHTFDKERIIDAVIRRGRDIQSGEEIDWADLPTSVAAEIFRKLILELNYDELYLPDQPGVYPLREKYKPEFTRKMRSLGVMSYQFIHCHHGNLRNPLVEGDGISDCYLSNVRELKKRKVFRDHGIKIIYSSFIDPLPVEETVQLQRLENWRSHWQRIRDETLADKNREKMRILSHARAERQREMIFELSRILQASSYSEEALTLRVFQALEDIAADSATRQILPKDTISMLRNLRLWLLPGKNALASFLDEGFSSTKDE